MQELADREAIRDWLMRYSRGVDRLDREIFLSAYLADAIDDHGKYIGVRKVVRDWMNINERPEMTDVRMLTSTRVGTTPELREFMNGGEGARSDRTDPSYRRRLEMLPGRQETYRVLVRSGYGLRGNPLAGREGLFASSLSYLF